LNFDNWIIVHYNPRRKSGLASSVGGGEAKKTSGDSKSFLKNYLILERKIKEEN
jgi:hypothetical protein